MFPHPYAGAFPREHLRPDERLLFEARPNHGAFLLAVAPSAIGWIWVVWIFFNPGAYGLYAVDSLALFCLGPLVVFAIGFGVMLLYRHFQWQHTAYAVTTARILTTTGVIGRTFVECAHDKIQNVTLRQGIIDRLFGSGTLVFATAGIGGGGGMGRSGGWGNRGMLLGGGLVFRSVNAPSETKRAVDELMESARLARRRGELQELASVIGTTGGRAFCAYCGGGLMPGARHCSQCGRPVD